MNWDIVAGNWKQFSGKVKSQWGNLTDDQLEKIAGKRTELAGRIQEAYGISKDEAEKQIKDFEALNKEQRRKSDSNLSDTGQVTTRNSSRFGAEGCTAFGAIIGGAPIHCNRASDKH